MGKLSKVSVAANVYERVNLEVGFIKNRWKLAKKLYITNC